VNCATSTAICRNFIGNSTVLSWALFPYSIHYSVEGKASDKNPNLCWFAWLIPKSFAIDESEDVEKGRHIMIITPRLFQPIYRFG